VASLPLLAGPVAVQAAWFAVDIVAMVLAMPRALFPETAAEPGGRGAAGWLYAAGAAAAPSGSPPPGSAGALLAAVLVGLALLVPALRDYDANARLGAAGHDTVTPQSGR
jgi:hypothetical protein